MVIDFLGVVPGTVMIFSNIAHPFVASPPDPSPAVPVGIISLVPRGFVILDAGQTFDLLDLLDLLNSQ